MSSEFHKKAIKRITPEQRAVTVNMLAIQHSLVKQLGPDGRMISGSKSGYHKRYPGHLVVFNANIVIKYATGLPKKIWYGDIDITLDEPAIVASIMNNARPGCACNLYVIRESDGRFENEDKPRLGSFVYHINSSLEIATGDLYDEYKRDAGGQLKRTE